MPAKEKYHLKGLIEKRFNDVKEKYKLLCEGFEEDDIHEFRLSVKRLKALLQLLLQVSDDKSLRKSLKKLTALYKACGRVRVLQIHLHVLEALPVTANTKSLITEIENTIQHDRKSLKQAYKKEPRLQLNKAKHLFLEHAKKLNEDDVADYFTNLKSTIKNLAQNIPNHPERWHELRKRIKELKYNYLLLGGPVQLPARLPLKADALIGNWHDTVDTIGYIQHLHSKRYKHVLDALHRLEQKQVKAIHKLIVRSSVTK